MLSSGEGWWEVGCVESMSQGEMDVEQLAGQE